MFAPTLTRFFFTGYQNSYPFLSAKCGITVKNNCVSPLYKSIINAEYPTMAFIGITKNIPIYPLVSLQVSEEHFKINEQLDKLQNINRVSKVPGRHNYQKIKNRIENCFKQMLKQFSLGSFRKKNKNKRELEC